MRIFRNHNEKHEKLFLQFLRFKWDKNEVNFYFFKTVRIFREGQEEYTRKNFARSFPHSIHKDFSHCFRFLCTQHKKSVDEKSGGEENLWNNSLQANESRKKNFWRRGERACERKFYYIYFFFGFYGRRQATEQKLPFDEALKVKQIEKHFFALYSLGSLVLWVRMNLTKSSKRSCTFEKSLLHEGISASQAGVTNILRNCAKFAHTRVVFRIKLR